MSKKLPNLLFFGIDSLRRDHMSHYGYPRLTTCLLYTSWHAAPTGFIGQIHRAPPGVRFLRGLRRLVCLCV